MPEIIAEVGKRYKVIIDKNNVWASIISERDRDNSFEYLITGLWRGLSGTSYNFNCEIINEVI